MKVGRVVAMELFQLLSTFCSLLRAVRELGCLEQQQQQLATGVPLLSYYYVLSAASLDALMHSSG